MMHEEKNNKKLSFQVKRRREDDRKTLLRTNLVLMHYTPDLTLNVSQKERIKILKQKKCYYSECRYAECRGAQERTVWLNFCKNLFQSRPRKDVT
jgi:hypothetical protein